MAAVGQASSVQQQAAASGSMTPETAVATATHQTAAAATASGSMAPQTAVATASGSPAQRRPLPSLAMVINYTIIYNTYLTLHSLTL